MRFLLSCIFALHFLYALTDTEIAITSSFRNLQIFLPTQEKFHTLSKDNTLTLTFNSSLFDKPITKELQAPFEKLEISQNSANKTQITLYGKNPTLSYQYTQNGLLLNYQSQIYQLQWWRYFAVLAFLSLLAIALFVVKKRFKSKPSNCNTQYLETPLKPNTKLITIQHQGHTYLIFCNEKGCTLLNHYPKTQDNKEFIDSLKEG